MEFLSFALQEVEMFQTANNGKTPLLVTFETHRQRLFGSPFQTREILKMVQEQTESYFSLLKLNADLSHWYCACERVFDPKQTRDETWWPALLEKVAERCYYIHARLGWSQGPQMADPSAPECEPERTLQVETCKVLVKEIMGRNDDHDDDSCFMSPEFGPPPYLPVMPHSQKPVASLPAAVAYTKTLLDDLVGQL